MYGMHLPNYASISAYYVILKAQNKAQLLVAISNATHNYCIVALGWQKKEENKKKDE